jgi:hypothetical protein
MPTKIADRWFEMRRIDDAITWQIAFLLPRLARIGRLLEPRGLR